MQIFEILIVIFFIVKIWGNFKLIKMDHIELIVFGQSNIYFL